MIEEHIFGFKVMRISIKTRNDTSRVEGQETGCYRYRYIYYQWPCYQTSLCVLRPVYSGSVV